MIAEGESREHRVEAAPSARPLLSNANVARLVVRTHQDLAAEIGSARELESRQRKIQSRISRRPRGRFTLHDPRNTL